MRELNVRVEPKNCSEYEPQIVSYWILYNWKKEFSQRLNYYIPMHILGPKPNGSQAKVWAVLDSMVLNHRSGLNESGSGKKRRSRPVQNVLAKTVI